MAVTWRVLGGIVDGFIFPLAHVAVETIRAMSLTGTPNRRLWRPDADSHLG
jgi:hypothetical protein